jgi:hypothetical protein
MQQHFMQQRGWTALMVDLQMARITLVVPASRARPAKLPGDAALAWSAMS